MIDEIQCLRDELAEAQNIIENLHTYLYDTGMWFICGCDRPHCTEMRVYLGTVKAGV